MSVSDPLLKALKGNIVKLLEHADKQSHISDNDYDLLELCKNMEEIFTRGCEHTSHGFALNKITYPWVWMNKIVASKHRLLTFSYINAIECVRTEKSVLTHLGKLHLLIRCCLQMKSLHVPVEYLLRTKQSLIYYKECSILGNEILSEIFLSLLLQCSRINFKLDLTNVAFLSVSWLMPEIVKIELVPCKSIGMNISFVGEQAIIVDIQSGSVISETGKVEVGDILDNLNGVHICLATKGKLKAIVAKSKSQPVKLTVVKAKYSNTNDLYQPIIPLLKQVKSSLLHLKNNQMDVAVPKKIANAGFKATYIGSVCTGKIGDVSQIESAFRMLLSPFNNYKQSSSFKCVTIKKPIHFEMGELGVKIIDSETLAVILKHSFMEISSCGSVLHMPNYFGYIAGNEYCNTATEFTCHIFHINSTDSAYTILQSMGQGFQRTHFVV